MAAIFLPDYQIPLEVPNTSRPASRPRLRLIEGGRVRSSRFRARRRKMTAIVASVTAVVCFILLSAVLFSLADAPSRPPAAATAVTGSAAAGGPVIVVQQGDTLTSIVQRLWPHGDTAALVSKLSERHGPGPLLAGDRISRAGLGPVLSPGD